MKYRTKREIRYRRGLDSAKGSDPEAIVIPAGTEVESIPVKAIKGYNDREAFKRWIRRDARGPRVPKLIVFKYDGKYRGARLEEDLEPVL